jgi:5-methylcytosine-specific restriction endonuclease McrA
MRQEYIDKRSLRGVCVRCGKPPVNKSVKYLFCEEHYYKKTASGNLRSAKHWIAVKNKLIAQGYKCAYTGELIEFGVNDTLDHILPKCRYPELARNTNNIEWITRKVNLMKRGRTRDEFLALANKILDYVDGKKSDQSNFLSSLNPPS